MRKLFTTCAMLGSLFLSSVLFANDWVKTYSIDPYIGPEIYYVSRLKEGGAKQTGPMYGVRIGYDYVRRFKLYWGMEALWAKGVLDGHVEDEHLKSNFTDGNIEARVGFTFQSQFWRCASFSPFAGVGYFWEWNNYINPSPLQIHFKNTFSYVPVGFLSQVFITPNWSIGLNCKVRIIFDGEQKVTHDPKFGRMTQHYDEKLQYRIELPVMYFFCWNDHSLGLNLVPFYEYREYGHRANFPFDFLKTTLKLYGATLKILYLF